MPEQKRILALSPHTDDAELGAGASIARWLSEGHRIYVFAFSSGDLKKGATFAEFARSMDVLGVTKYDMGNFACHYFPRERQKIIEMMLGLRDTWKPDVVLCPSTWDCHQDHQVICAEAVRVFKASATILGYDAVWNAVTGNHRLNKFVEINAQHISKKLEAIRCYESQTQRPMMHERFLYSLAWMRGVQAGMEYAEAFEVIRERE